MTVAGLMNKSKYSHNIIRTGDIMTGAPFTVLNSETGTVVQLPLPMNLNSALGSDWQQQQVSITGMLLRHNKKKIKEVMSASSIKDGINALTANIIPQIEKDAQELMARASASKSELVGARLASNPRNEMLFTGMQFRSFSFTFNLVPYRKEDSDNIQKAIREIQKASVPSMRGEKMFMEYPETWWITFMDGTGSGNEYLMKINECCCTNVSVNYTAHGASNNLHKNNAPLAVELTLDFTEVYIPTKENIDEFNG